MPKRIFHITVIKGYNKMIEGMRFEVTSSHSKPTTSEIREAFKAKFGMYPPTTQEKYLKIE